MKRNKASKEWSALMRKMELYKKAVGKSWGKELSKATRIEYRRLYDCMYGLHEPSFTRGLRINSALDSWFKKQKNL
jgi:hypothetical protein